MGSAHVERLESLLASTSTSDDAAIKGALIRLSADIKSRLAKSTNSTDFFAQALAVLSRMRGTTNSDVRLSCLWEVTQYFYFNGLPAQALSSALALRSLSSLANHQLWMRKAAMMTAVVHADLGNVGDALIDHARRWIWRGRRRISKAKSRF